MRNNFKRAAIVVSFVALAVAEAAMAQSREDMLVTTDWLAGHLQDENVVLLHVGAAKDYETGHIPGARLVTLADLSITGPNGLRLELPPEADLRAAVGKLGIREGMRVIIYPGSESVQSATRVWFTFDYLGWGQHASLLDGGLALWKREGKPISTEAVSFEPAEPVGGARPELVVTADWIQQHASDQAVRLIDARLPEFYSGANAGNMPRAGHIPGAHSAPFPTMFDGDGRLRTNEELIALLGAENAERTFVSYCHIGQQATVLYFVARTLGLEARLYDGSFQEWSARTDLPVEK